MIQENVEETLLIVIQKYGGIMTEDKTKENRIFWDQLRETNPKMTQQINKGFGNLTSIDPHWQIMIVFQIVFLQFSLYENLH